MDIAGFAASNVVPLVGLAGALLGALLGVIGNGVANSRREKRAFLRDKTLEYILECMRLHYDLTTLIEQGEYAPTLHRGDRVAIANTFPNLAIRARFFGGSSLIEAIESVEESAEKWFEAAVNHPHGSLESWEKIVVHEAYNDIRSKNRAFGKEVEAAANNIRSVKVKRRRPTPSPSSSNAAKPA